MLRNTTLTLIFLFAAGSADADWAVINLSPPSGAAFGIGDGQQVGHANGGHASLWTGTAGSYVDLAPAGSDESQALGASGGRQVGWATPPGESTPHAGMWSGSAASWVDLNPSGATQSGANCVTAEHQFGWANIGGLGHAGMWSGSSGSWTDFSPPGTYASTIFGADDLQQVGVAGVNSDSYFHASLWYGTQASWVDLNPVGSMRSFAYGAGDGQQVGYALGMVGGERASLWTGSAASWVNLGPFGAGDSIAFGAKGGLQVGEVNIGGDYRASLWSGTAASWVDLHALLPPSFTFSSARGIWRNAEGFVYVIGYGQNSSTSRREALMWVTTQTIAATTTLLSPGIVVSGTPADLNSSNDVYYTLRPGVVLSSSQSPISNRSECKLHIAGSQCARS